MGRVWCGGARRAICISSVNNAAAYPLATVRRRGRLGACSRTRGAADVSSLAAASNKNAPDRTRVVSPAAPPCNDDKMAGDRSRCVFAADAPVTVVVPAPHLAAVTSSSPVPRGPSSSPRARPLPADRSARPTQDTDEQ